MTLGEYRSSLCPSDRDLFDEFVGIGIRKTIYALLDANVCDTDIQRVVIDQWEVSKEEFATFLIEAKKEIAKYLLREYLMFQGYTPSEADDFMVSNMVRVLLNRDHELLKQWKNPEKLLKDIQKKSK